MASRNVAPVLKIIFLRLWYVSHNSYLQHFVIVIVYYFTFQPPPQLKIVDLEQFLKSMEGTGPHLTIRGQGQIGRDYTQSKLRAR